ncbi:MAG: type IV pilus assembly protein PilM [bacterium]
MLPRTGKTIGIDIGQRDIKLVQIRGGSRNPVVEGWALLEKEKGNYDAGRWRPDLAEDLRLAFQLNGIRGGKAAVSLPDSMVNIYYRKLPPMPEEELKNAVVWEIRKDLTFPVDDVVIDHINLGEVSEGSDIMNAYLIAVTRKRPLEDLCRYLTDVGMKINCLEFSTMAQVTCLKVMGEMSGTVALVDIGATQTNLVVLKDGKIRFFRVIPSGGDVITETISHSTGLSWWEAEKVKSVGIGPEKGGDEQVVRALHQSIESIVDEVYQTFHFYTAERREGGVDRLVISGGGGMMKGIDKFFQDILGMPTQVMDPFAGIQVSGKLRDGELLVSWGCRIATALGLALEE